MEIVIAGLAILIGVLTVIISLVLLDTYKSREYSNMFTDDTPKYAKYLFYAYLIVGALVPIVIIGSYIL